jgi:cold shock protein
LASWARKAVVTSDAKERLACDAHSINRKENREVATETGIIKRFIEERGFGFIKPDLGGIDIFFHIEAFEGDEPQIGQRVAYETATDARSGRPRAVNVRLAKGPEIARIVINVNDNLPTRR